MCPLWPAEADTVTFALVRCNLNLYTCLSGDCSRQNKIRKYHLGHHVRTECLSIDWVTLYLLSDKSMGQMCNTFFGLEKHAKDFFVCAYAF